MNEINLREEKQSHDFQIVLLDRDSSGKPTGKKVYYSSDKGSEISDFYEKHVSLMNAKLSKKKRRVRNKDKKK